MADSKTAKSPDNTGDKSLLDESRPGGESVSLTEPNDELKLVYFVFLLHGVGILLPWNSFINAKDYFVNFKLNTAESAISDYRLNFMNYIGLASQLPNLLMSAFNVFFQSTRSTVQTGNSIPKLLVVIAMEIAVCTFTCALAIVNSTTWPRLFFDFTILSVVVLNCCTGVYQSSAFGMAAILPMAYSNAIVLGNNVCGTLIAVANILCKLASANNLQMTAIFYFTFSTLLLAFCFGSLFVLPKLRFYRYFQTKQVEIPMMEVTFTVVPGSDDDANNSKCKGAPMQVTQNSLLQDTCCESDQVPVLSPPAAAACGGAATITNSACGQYTDTARECCACFCGTKSLQIAHRYWQRYWLAFKDGWIHCLSIWSIFFCTLSCFPAVQSSVRPVYRPKGALGDVYKEWFTDVCVFLFFNLFAMIGNIVSNFVQYPKPRWLAYVVWFRTLAMIPFFVLCNCLPDSRSPDFPVLIHSDAAFILGMIVFAFSSGYLCSLCMMYAPRRLNHPEYASLVAMLATFCLVLGVVCGIGFGTFLTNAIRSGWRAPHNATNSAVLNGTFNIN